MQIDFYGANCFRLKVNQTTFIFDDNLSELGGKSVVSAKDVVCLTHPSLPSTPGRLLFDAPGSYEVDGILVTGVSARFLGDLEDTSGVIYKLTTAGMNLVVAGQNKAHLDDEQLEELGGIDILCVPVGGLSTVDNAWQFVKDLEPKLVIPAYYKTSLKGSADWGDVADFVTRSQLTPEDVQNPLRLKKADLGGEQVALKIFRS